MLKTTNFAPDGSKEVCVMNESTKQEKIAIYRDNGSLANYIEINSPKDKIMMSFNKNGELIKVSWLSKNSWIIKSSFSTTTLIFYYYNFTFVRFGFRTQYPFL